jgi:hypothetical protein
MFEAQRLETLDDMANSRPKIGAFETNCKLVAMERTEHLLSAFALTKDILPVTTFPMDRSTR